MERLWIVSNVLGWAIALAQALALFAVVHHVGKIHLRRTSRFNALIVDDGPEIHSPLPELAGTDLSGRSWSSRDLSGKEWVLLVVSPGCAPCETILSAIRPLQQSLPKPPEFVVLVDTVTDTPLPDFAKYRFRGSVVPDRDGEMMRRLGLERTPVGLLLDCDGTVRMKGVVNDRDQLEGLIQRRGRYLGSPQWQTVIE